MAKQPKKITLRIANTEFTIGDILEIVPKPDLDAPSGFIQHGTSKLLMKGIKEVKGVPWDETLRMWDTGFEEDSNVNRTLKQADKKAMVAEYTKLVKEPYEKRYRVDASSVNDDFWGGNDEKKIPPYMYEVYTGRRIDTTNEKDLFDLFQMLKQGAVCEPREKDPNLQRSANYCIKNIKKARSMQEEKIETKFEAAAIFSTLLKLDPKKDDTLYTILDWVNVPNVRGAEESAVKRVVLGSFENEKLGFDNAQRFMEAYEMTTNDKEKEVMEIFGILNKLYLRKVIEYKRRQFFMPDGTFLGNHLKEAARKAASDKELSDQIDDLYAERIIKA